MTGVWRGCGAAVWQGGLSGLAWVLDGATWGVGTLRLANGRAEAEKPATAVPGGPEGKGVFDATG